MGYACPVCSTPQADERHLADHLAVMAMVHGDEHETWLDEHAAEWPGMRPDELGPIVADHATVTGYTQVFEDTTNRGGPSRGRPHHSAGRQVTTNHSDTDDERGVWNHTSPVSLDEHRAITEEALEMTRKMVTPNDDDTEVDDDTGGDERKE